MKIRSDIENVNSRYRVQIDTLGFTAIEEEKMCEFGEPQIDVGSSFSGSVSRPGQAPTTATITPVGSGSGATGTVTVDDTGAVVSVTITAGGSGYTNGATVAFDGDGSGATGIVTVASGVVTGIVIDDAGSGYHQVPLPVSFSLTPQLRRIRTDFPVIQVFDLNDTVDADVQAKVFSDTIVARLTAAKNGLILMGSDFAGETLVTV